MSRDAAGKPRVLLVTPPMTQLNTPYPATPYLTGFLASRGFSVAQADLSLETALALFSRRGVANLFAAIRDEGHGDHSEVARFLDREPAYLDTIDPIVRFLQGRDPTLATRICQGGLLPEGPRFDADELDEEWAFGALATTDRARRLATLYLYDLADLVAATVAPRFGLSRYAESLATAAGSFDPIAAALAEPPGFIDRLAEEALAKHVERAQPDLVGLTVPFPGNVFGALRLAQALRRDHPSIRIALGGGYANTELRQLTEPRLFDLIDYLTLDDGERPLLALLDHLGGGRGVEGLARTMVREGVREGVRAGGKVMLCDGAGEPDIPQSELGAPSYLGLLLGDYLSVIESPNPMHRLWSDGRWSKLTVAHGCYWKKCTFCDVSLDYIGRYEPSSARALVDRMDALSAETGDSGFHFVDEAAPPLALIEIALELCARGRCVSWWGNIRFEKTFTADVCRLLAASGCIAVSGGLEVASDRLLELMQKGVTVAQVARVAAAFDRAGVMVHAYLMYGFPTETEQETLDSLERVRQLFEAGAIQSAFWHRFALTRHAPIARDPERYKILVTDGKPKPFANNDLAFKDPTGCDPEKFAEGLRTALFNYMHGIGIERDVRTWFDFDLPRPKVAQLLVKTAILVDGDALDRPDARLVWLGGAARAIRGGVSILGRTEEKFVALGPKAATWTVELLKRATPLDRQGAPWPRKSELAADFPGGPKAFARFVASDGWHTVRQAGLVEIP